MIVVWLFLAVSWVCLQFLIVAFPDHTHLLFFYMCVAGSVEKRIILHHYFKILYKIVKGNIWQLLKLRMKVRWNIDYHSLVSRDSPYDGSYT